MSDETASRDDQYADVDTSHLEDVEDGCGCTEIWEHTSERDEPSPDVDEGDELSPEADEGDEAEPEASD